MTNNLDKIKTSDVLKSNLSTGAKIVAIAILEGAATARQVSEATNIVLRTVERHYADARSELRKIAEHTQNCVVGTQNCVVEDTQNCVPPTQNCVSSPSRAYAGITSHANKEYPSDIVILDIPPLPPKGGANPKSDDPFGLVSPLMNDGVELLENGSIKLFNGTLSYWLEQFDGDHRQLQLALMEIANGRDRATREPIAKTVNRRLSHMCRDERGKTKRYNAKANKKPGISAEKQAEWDSFMKETC